jgi:ribosomal protein S18 acetylase RimI-like enzyme
MKNFLTSFRRYLNGLRRPSKQTNMRKLHDRGETIDSFTFRDATEQDIHELAILHVTTWQQTYRVLIPPTYKIREYQWRKVFGEENDGSWFCILVVDKKNQLVGFAKGKKYKHSDLPEFSGELNKIYLLCEYQRIGLGRRLLGHVARRFLSMGINNMVLFGVAQNPSCAFHEAMGGERLYAKNGEFHGGYSWRDLKKLAANGE